MATVAQVVPGPVGLMVALKLRQNSHLAKNQNGWEFMQYRTGRRKRLLCAAAYMRSALELALLFAAGTFGASAYAAHPLLTEDTATQGEGNSQLELTVDAFRDRLAGTDVRGVQSTALYSYGVSRTADLQIGLPYLRVAENGEDARALARGSSDLSVDLKWRFIERDAVSVGFKPGITLPTGDEEKFLGAGHVTWGALLVGSYESGAVAFHSHAGYRYYDNVVDLRTSLWHFSIAATWQVVDPLKLVADLSRDTNPEPGSSSHLDYLIIGAIWTPVKNLDLDIGYRHGTSGAALDRGVLAGMTLRW